MTKTVSRDTRPATFAFATAVQALFQGKASEEQQRMAMNWIIDRACAFRDEPFCNEKEGGERATSFNLGRQFVGREIMYLATLPADEIEKLKKAKR